MSEVNVIYKSIFLYLLDKSELPLSTATINEFFVGGGLIDYFQFQTLIAELKDNELLEISATQNVTNYTLSEKGRHTLTYMRDRISSEMDENIREFLKKHDFAIKQNHTLISNYDNARMGGFIVHLRAKDGEEIILDLSLHVAGEEMAKAICTNWKENHEKVYELLIEGLLG